MKKAKYSIEFDYLEQLGSTEIVISKAEFDKQLNHLKKQAQQSKELDYECPVELNEETKENDRLIITTYHAKSGCADVWLKSYVCKDGWSFANKGGAKK